MHDYKVATYGQKRGAVTDRVPEGKRHAFLQGAKKTVCGFGLVDMRVFDGLNFDLEPRTLRCPLCARLVGADH